MKRDGGFEVRSIRKFARDCRGATVIEYGLILAVIFLVIMVSVNTVATHIIATWGSVNRQVGAATT